MESPSSTRARWPGNDGNNDGLPWAFGKANTGNSVAGFPGSGMPGTYPISPETSGSLHNFDPDDPGERTWHDRSARNSLRGTAVSHGSASAASEFVVDIENLRIGVGNNEAGVGTFDATRTVSVQQPLPVYHSDITSIHSPIPTRQYHHSNTWSMSDFGRESGEVPRYPVNFSHLRTNALSGVFTLDIPQKSLARVNSTISPHRVTTPDIGIQLAAYAIADKSPGILSYIFGAVKGFFSCVGSRHKDSRPQDIHEDTHNEQTHSMPVDEFVITIDEADLEETAREGTISSETELDYASEMERIRNAQMGLADEEERPQSILLPPCPIYVAEQFARPRSKSDLPPSTLHGSEELPRPRSRPISYPGAPETESVATIRQVIAAEMAEGPLDTIDDYASSDIDEYHAVLRSGIGAEVGVYHETLQEIEAAQIKRGDHEVYTPTPKKPKKKGKERLNHLLSPIMDAASSVKTFLSSTISDVHEKDDHDLTPSEDASSSTPTLIRAAIGTSVTNACRPTALRRSQDSIAADDVDTPEEIENPKLLELFGGKKPSEEYLRPQTPDAKANYDYWKKEIRYRRRKLVVKEETEDSLYLFDHNMWGDESLGFESPGFDKREIPENNSPREYSEEQPEEKGIPEEEVCEEQSIRDSSEIEVSDSVVVGDCMTKENSGNIVAGENVCKLNVDEYVKMHHDQLESEQAFTGMFEEKMVFDAAHPDSDTPDGFEGDPSDGRNDFDGCKVLGSPTFGNEDNSDLFPAKVPLVERRVSNISAISTTSVISKAEAIKVLRQELHHLGIGSSGDPLIDKLTWTSRHTSIVSFVERPNSFQNLVNLFGDEEESEDDSKEPKHSFGGNSSLFRKDQMGNATNIHVPSGAEHISHYFRTAEVRVRHGIANESSATLSKEHVGRMSYTHLYDEEDRVASDEEEQEHEKEYKRYYEEQLQLQCG